MAEKPEILTTTTNTVSNQDAESQEKTRIHGVDDAFAFAVEASEASWTDAEEKTVRWKIDLVIVPLLVLGSITTYSDSQAYGFSALFGMVADLKLYSLRILNGQFALDLTKFSFSSAISHLGSVAAQYPLLALAQFFPYGKFMSTFVVLTGLLSLLTIVCKDYAQILALRFFFGFTAITEPLSIIITSMWWKRDEQPLRVGLYIGGSALGALVGQAVDVGAVKINGEFAGHSWKWIYLILGVATIGYGLIMFALFSGSPMTAWFLNPREKVIAVRRLIENNTGIQSRQFKWKHVREAFTDPQLPLLGVYAFSFAFVNAAVGTFGTFLTSSFGFSKTRALLLTMPIAAVALFSLVLSGVLGSWFPRKRLLIAMLFILPSIAGNAMLWKIDRANVGGLLAGLYISSTFYGALVQQFSLLASNIAGNTKKSTVNATIVLLSQLGGFAGPFAYKGSEAAEGYPTGQISALVLLCASEASMLVLWWYYSVQNKKKAAFREAHPELVNDPNNALVDHTDKENPIFQYRV